MRLRASAGVGAAAMALVALGSTTATAVTPPPNPGPDEVKVTAFGATNTICYFNALKPNHSGSRMTGTGGIKSCTGGPVACSSEVDLEFYNNFSRMWMTAGTSSRQFLCAPPLRSTTAAATCIYQPGDPTVAWRTSTLGSMVNASGASTTATAYSPILYIACA
ncbi:hypothetical protein [Streptomyces sp. NPDC056049]|uniref:hypothetical protein n=1 Tax=Streptomyces sp. NPDC056049 TaxID=3345693 RepID=UPI0035DE6C88